MDREQAFKRANEIIKELRIILPALGDCGHNTPLEPLNRDALPEATATVSFSGSHLVELSDYQDDVWRDIKAKLDGSPSTPLNTSRTGRRKLGGNSEGYTNTALDSSIRDQFGITQKRTPKRLGRNSAEQSTA